MDIDVCFKRNSGTINTSQQHKLKDARITVFGLGGVGGIAAELLVRAGIGHLMIIDFDRFEPSNLNRQIHAQKKTIGKKKVDVFAEKMMEINPKIKINKSDKKIEFGSLASFSRALSSFSPGLVIDTMDSAHSRVCLARICRKAGIDYLYAAAMGERGMVSVLSSSDNLEKILYLPSLNKPDEQIESSLIHYPQCKTAWGPATNLVGVLAANAALNFLLKKPYPHAPKFWMVDTFGKKIVREEQL